LSPRAGHVVRYSYVWRDEGRRGETAGRKDRPCVIVLATEEVDGKIVVTVVPVTHSRPSDPTIALEIPRRVKARLGLDDAPSWIIAEEANRFVWPGPDVRHVPGGGFVYGELPAALFQALRERVLALAREGRMRALRRTE